MAYNLLVPVQVVTNGSLAADLTSDVIEIRNQDNVGIQLNWTGTPTGDFVVEISIDYQEDSLGNVLSAGNWIELPLSPAITAAGSADQAYIDLNQMSASYVRVRFIWASGTGTLNAFMTAKGI